MPRNSNGDFSLVAGNPVITGTVIESNWANNTMPDIGIEITDSLSRSGKGGMTAPLRGTNGTAPLPAYSYANFPNLGSYAFDATDMRLSVGGVDRMRLRSTPNPPQIWDAVNSVWEDFLTNANTARPNLLINGAFDHWQRGTSQTDSGILSADMWDFEVRAGSSGVGSFSRQVSAASQVDRGFGEYYATFEMTTGSTGTPPEINQKIEGIVAAGQSVTLSFQARAQVGTATVEPSIEQNFGAGGSTTVITPGGDVLLTNSFVQYEVAIAVPAVSGETIGSDPYTMLALNISGGIVEVDIANIKLEIGIEASQFTRAGGTVGGDLTLAERFYFELLNVGVSGDSAIRFANTLPISPTMRAVPVLDVVLAAGTGGSFTATTKTIRQNGTNDQNTTATIKVSAEF